MLPTSKLKLSTEELQFVSNADWILTKRQIITGVVQLMSELAETVRPLVYANEKKLPAEIVSSSPKISKGENYKLLPWVMLDYPRFFNKENVFAIRTMFWWGNAFSVTLHLSGIYKKHFEKSITNNINLLPQKIFICVSEDEWQHDFTADNYTAVSTLSTAEVLTIIYTKPFIKLALKHPLEEWNRMPEVLKQSFLNALKIITS